MGHAVHEYANGRTFRNLYRMVTMEGWKKLVGVVALIALLIWSPPCGAMGREDVEVLVVQGDNLVDICLKYLEYPEEWPQVAAANQLEDPHRIYPGQKMIIPARLLRGIPTSGSVSFVKGTVEIQRPGQVSWGSLSLKDSVEEGSSVRTGSDSALEISFGDGSTLLLRSETTVGMTRVRQRGVMDFIGDLFLQGGSIINNIKRATGNEPRYRIRTPSTIAAARGTEFRVAHDRKATSRVEVLEGKVSARGRGRTVDLAKGEGTVVRAGADPKAPIRLLNPPNLINPEPLYRKMPLEFRFDRVVGAVSYRVLVARDSGFKEVVHDGVTGAAELSKVESLDDGTFLMQVASIDGLGLEGIPSAPYSVKVRTNPVPPFVQSPSDGKEYKTVTMEFSWLQVEDASKYTMQISDGVDFVRLLDEKELIRKTSYKTKALNPGTYFFRVRSHAEDGYVGVWSDPIRFSLLEPPPAPPASPPKKDKKEIGIRWKDIGEGYTYHFQLAADRDFNEILMDKVVEKSEHTFTKPRKPGVYYVRISAVRADGFEGHFSAPQSFEIGCLEN